MATSAQLNIKVESTGVDKTKKKLKGLETQSQKTETKTKGMQNSFSKLSKGLVSTGGVVLAVGAVSGALSALVAASASATRELALLSRQAKLSIGEFNSLAFATNQYGVNAEQIADISKDVSDKVGEFATVGTGAFQDYADVMGLTKSQAMAVAREFEAMSSDQVIGAMVSRMEAAGASGNQMTFVLESMGNDLSKLTPLFASNSDKLKELRGRYDDLNKSMELTAGQGDDLRAVAESFDLLATTTGNAANAIASTVAPQLEAFFNGIVEVVPTATNAIVDFLNSFQDASTIQSASSLNRLIEDQKEKIDSLKMSLSGYESANTTYSFTESQKQSLINKTNSELKEEAERLADLESQLESVGKTQESANKVSLSTGSFSGSGDDGADKSEEALSRFQKVTSQIQRDWEERVRIAQAASLEIDNISKDQFVSEATESVSYENQLTALEDYYKTTREKALSSKTALAQIETEYNSALDTLELEHQANITDMQKTASEARIQLAQDEALALQQAYSGLASALSSSFASIASAIESSGDDSSAAYSAAFALSKGFAVAQASLNLQSAILQQYADPTNVTFADKIAKVAAITSAAGSLVSTISGISYSGRAQGGDTNPNGTYMVGERGPELVTFGRDGGSVASNSQMQQQSSAASKTNYTIVNQTSGSVGEVEQQNVTPNDVVLILRETVPAEIKNSNSKTSKSLSRNTSSGRRYK